MDPRVAGAGVAMAVAMLLLLPTFNALNNSYATDIPPPSWLPQPDEIPEDFQPPEDFEYPEGWEPPPNMTPPPGWEPPPGYDGPIPPGGCPPPLVRPIEEFTRSGSWSAGGGSFPVTMTFEAPKYMAGFGGNITFSSWRARTVSFEVEDPNGTTLGSDAQGGPGAGSILVPATPVSETTFTFQTADPRETGELPPQGTYTLILDVELPVDGNWETEFVVAIACGGILE